MMPANLRINDMIEATHTATSYYEKEFNSRSLKSSRVLFKLFYQHQNSTSRLVMVDPTGQYIIGTVNFLLI